jgi:hypothetical protein
MSKNVVIWGLKSIRHSHRYIHQGFQSTFQRLGYDVVWVDDKVRNQKFLEGSNLVVSVDIASKNLVWYKNNKYILHNVERQDFQGQKNVLNLQVFSSNSFGSAVDDSIALYDKTSQTLFQPWGVSEPITLWKTPSRSHGKVEYWVGAIWNNNLNQGNRPIMDLYGQVLNSRGIKFKRIGGTRSLGINGINPIRSLELVNCSPVGSQIVGNWQKEKRYVPCRLFKNIAAGQPPSSNADFSFILKDLGYYSEDLESLVEHSSKMSYQSRLDLVREAQKAILSYTYEKGITRILQALNY